MSSPKGDKYEAFVMDVLKSEIEKGKLPFPVGQTTLTPKKKYRARSDNDIEVDVAIEVFRDPTKKPFLITLVECKDYAKPIDTMRIGWKNRSRLGQCAVADWDTFDAAKFMIFSETVAF